VAKTNGFLTIKCLTAHVRFPAVATFHLWLPWCIRLATLPHLELFAKETRNVTPNSFFIRHSFQVYHHLISWFISICFQSLILTYNRVCARPVRPGKWKWGLQGVIFHILQPKCTFCLSKLYCWFWKVMPVLWYISMNWLISPYLYVQFGKLIGVKKTKKRGPKHLLRWWGELFLHSENLTALLSQKVL
jgi:hypothetical protein